MAETEELQIKVTLVEGNTVEKLREMRKEIEALGGGGTAAQLERFSRQARDAREKGLKPFSEDLEVASKRMIPFIGGIGGIATGLIAVGYAADKALEGLNDFAKVQERIGILSKQTGFDPAFVKIFQEQFKLAGVEDATRDLQGLSQVMADMTRANGEFQRKMRVGAGLEGAGAMQQWLTEFATIKDPSKAANKLREGLEIVRKHAIAQWGEQRGADVMRKFEADIGMPDLDRLLKDLPEVSAEEKKLQASRQKAADDYLKTSREISLEWEHVKEFWTDETLGSSALATTSKWLLQQLKDVNRIMRDPVGTQADPSKPPRWITPPTPGAEPPASQTSAPAVSGQRRPGGRVRLGGGAVPLMGGLAPDEWPESTNIEDRRGEAPFVGDDGLKVQRELMEQTKRLADDFEQAFGVGTGGLGGGAQGLMSGGSGGSGGLGGRAGGLAAAAGLNDIGSGPNGSDVGPGTGRGAGGTPAGAGPAGIGAAVSMPGLGGLPGFGGRGRRGRGGHLHGGDVGPGTGEGAGETPAGGGAAGVNVGGGAEFLKQQRAAQFAEIEKNPALKRDVLKMLQTEEGNVPGRTATLEALLNRTQMTHTGIERELHSGFYGPINRGALAGGLSKADQAISEKAYEAAKAGSFIAQGRTDQGTIGDPNDRGPGRIGFPGMNRRSIFNYWKGTRGGHYFSTEDSQRFAEAQAAGVAASQEAADTGISPARNRFTRQAWADRTAIDQGMAQRVEGTGKLSVHVNAPRGTKVGAEGGGLFKKTEVTRQTQMEPAASSMASQYQE